MAGHVEKAGFGVISARKTWKVKCGGFRTHRRGAAAGVAFVNTQLHVVAVTSCFLSH